MKFYKSSLNFSNNITIYKEFFGCFENGLYSIWWFVFLSSWPTSLWGAITFPILFHFWRFFVHYVHNRRGSSVFLQIKIKWSPPLGSSLPWTLKCYSYNSFAINEQLKDLTHMLCLQIPCYKLYEEGLFSYVLALKYTCHFGMNFKKFNVKAKHKIKK